jgi:hypothetical protein
MDLDLTVAAIAGVSSSARAPEAVPSSRSPDGAQAPVLASHDSGFRQFAGLRTIDPIG